MSERIKWVCPACARRFSIPVGNLPRLCPDCANAAVPPDEPAETRPRKEWKIAGVGILLLVAVATAVGAYRFANLSSEHKANPGPEHKQPDSSDSLRSADADSPERAVEKNSASADKPPDALPKELSLADLVEQVETAVVRLDVTTKSGKILGSGFLVRDGRTIITNFHVVKDAVAIEASFQDGVKVRIAGVLSLDPGRDIAILKTAHECENVVPLELAVALPRKGEEVLAFGSPRGLSFTASNGIVSAVRQPSDELKAFGVTQLPGVWIQTTAPISPGNSGGPLVSRNGEVVGASTWYLRGGQNLNFAISSIDIGEVLKRPEEYQTLPISSSIVARKKPASRELPPIRDIAGTKEGVLFVERIKAAKVFVKRRPRAGVFQPGAANNAKLSAEKSLKKTGIRVLKADSEEPGFAVLVISLTESKPNRVSPTARLDAEMLVLNKRDNEEPEIVIVWSGMTYLNALHRSDERVLSRLFREIESIRNIVRSPEEEERVARSRFNLATILLKKGRVSEARKRLRSVVSEFPNTMAAKDASELLEPLGSRE